MYEALRLPWGSNPVTDPMLGSAAFPIVHDGCDLARWEKAELVADWPEAGKYLRVCWEGDRLDRNCGRCMRCVGTAIGFAAVGKPIPESIPVDSPIEAVQRLQKLDPDRIQRAHYENMIAVAQKRGITADWVAALAATIRDNETPKRKRWFRR